MVDIILGKQGEGRGRSEERAAIWTHIKGGVLFILRQHAAAELHLLFGNRFRARRQHFFGFLILGIGFGLGFLIEFWLGILSFVGTTLFGDFRGHAPASREVPLRLPEWGGGGCSEERSEQHILFFVKIVFNNKAFVGVLAFLTGFEFLGFWA